MAREFFERGAVAVLVLSVAACASAASTVGDAPQPGAEPQRGTVEAGNSRQVPTTDSDAPRPATLESLTDAVLEHAARETGLARDALVVTSAEPVTWPDGSLGCPQPGMMYTQALVPGYRIRVRAGNDLLDYHASRRGSFVLCPAGRGVEPAGDATT
jgi:hypothetical protein